MFKFVVGWLKNISGEKMEAGVNILFGSTFILRLRITCHSKNKHFQLEIETLQIFKIKKSNIDIDFQEIPWIFSGFRRSETSRSEAKEPANPHLNTFGFEHHSL